MGICIGPSRRTEMRWCWLTAPDRMRNDPCWLRLLGRSRTQAFRCCALICHSGKRRPHGPPFPAVAAKAGKEFGEQWSLCAAQCRGACFLAAARLRRPAGDNAGGRRAGTRVWIVAAVDPLHPPRKPEQKRDAHFPKLQTESLFVHGSRDPFGSPEEMAQALKLIPARTN